MNHYLLLDVHNICYRNWYAMQSKYNRPASIGLLRSMCDLSQHHGTDRFLFCFDAADGYARRDLLPDYKHWTVPLERKAVQREIDTLRDDILPALGYTNLFYRDRAEADDLIGILCCNRPVDDKYTIISTDKDMYQLLLEEQVEIWDHATKYTMSEKRLLSQFKLTPAQWLEAKAMSGCTSDNVPGIVDIGIARASSYILGKLSCTSAVYQKIEANRWLIEKNRRLVTLPFESLAHLELPITEDTANPERWRRMMSVYRFDSLAGRNP